MFKNLEAEFNVLDPQLQRRAILRTTTIAFSA